METPASCEARAAPSSYPATPDPATSQEPVMAIMGPLGVPLGHEAAGGRAVEVRLGAEMAALGRDVAHAGALRAGARCQARSGRDRRCNTPRPETAVPGVANLPVPSWGTYR